MLRTTKNMKDKYEKIQNYLFDLIPEKWDEIYLYASIVDRPGSVQTGEMYFYYLPKGLLKKKPVNVYEVPKRFNINESEYLKLVDNLYQTIKDLRQDFEDTEQDLWTNITISIAHCRFKVEFNYDKISQEEYASYVRHVIWRYKYLHLGGEIKEDRKILDKYFEHKLDLEGKKEEYQAGMYLKTANNIVGYDREIKAVQEKQKEQKIKSAEIEERKKEKRLQRAKKEAEKRRKEEEKNKNQILKM
mgnify:FL=1